MAKFLCDYCKEWIETTEENCPNCGAPNKNYARVAKGTPKTIEELKSWYIARNLPPEETTRFFIGKNISEPRAFGIYEENGIFTVYKNKSNGERAIRYEGEDEAYAVKELYLRLKEEILNQKNINQRKRSSGGSSYSSSRNRRKKNKLSSLIVSLITIVFLTGVIGIPFSIYMIEDAKEAKNDYYFDGDTLYHCEFSYDGGTKCEWWIYDEKDEAWEFLKSTDSKEPIEGMNNKEHRVDFLGDIREQFAPEMDSDEFYDKYDIYNSKEYIDAGHHFEPSQGYYKTGDDVYYYLNDSYGDSYGTRDNTGWYRYINDSWEYYCSYDDKEKVGDELWYNDDDYNIGSSYVTLGADGYDFENYQWSFTNFENTEWYEEAEAAEKAYDKYQEEHKNDYDNDWDDDNDWDWDSGDDWDAGGTDWDSDW